MKRLWFVVICAALIAGATACDETKDSSGEITLDQDSDGVADGLDNCPEQANPGQEDADDDGLGDACDTPEVNNNSNNSNNIEDNNTPPPDRDADGLLDDADNCPDVPNPDQGDLDGDEVGDVCDDDRDGDGVLNNADNCPELSNADQANLDSDESGDVCDDDRDGDGQVNVDDNCPDAANTAQDDADLDGEGDVCDDDRDGDNIANANDNCPDVANTAQADLDEDGEGNACDSDLDGDGVANDADNCPGTSNADQANLDEDGDGDACDDDLDGDGVPNDADNCPALANADQANLDSDAQGDLCDDDVDGDDVPNDADNCLTTPNTDQSDLDADASGDACDDDVDGDEVLNDDDNCPVFANPDQADLNENALGDACEDTDEDLILNGLDNCPLDPNTQQEDADEDGLGDACDNCAMAANPDQLDTEPAGFTASATSIDFLLREIPETVAVGGDDNVASLPTGFPITFFGQTWDSISVSTNGILGFGEGLGSGCCSAGSLEGDNGGEGGTNIPTGGLIAVHWTDLNPSVGGTITYGVFGEAPSRELVISYNAVAHFGGGDPVSAQVVFTEGQEGVEIHCASCISSTERSHTQGVAAPDGATSASLPGRVQSVYSLTNDAVRFSTGVTMVSDGVGDVCDVCPLVLDPDQLDTDEDGVGDACDVCPEVSDPDQLDFNRDGLGDACSDLDQDGIFDLTDNCLFTFNDDQADLDEDGVGDACDNCPDTFNPDQAVTFVDEGGGGPGAACSDLDEDGIFDLTDNCIFTFNDDQADFDEDGVGDACDSCPMDADPSASDLDNDGVGDVCDNCPETFNPDQRDLDTDGVGDLCGRELDCADGYDLNANDQLDEDAALCASPPVVFCEQERLTVFLGTPVGLFAGIETLGGEEERGVRRLGWDVVDAPEGADVSPAPGNNSYFFTAEVPGTYTFAFYVVESYGQSDACLATVQVIELRDCADGIDNDGDDLIDEDAATCDGAPEVLCPDLIVVPSFGTAALEALSDAAFGVIREGWEVALAPGRSDAAPTPDDAAQASFTPDLFGDWVLRYTVLDTTGQLISCESPLIHEEPLDCEDSIDSDGDGQPDENPGCELPPVVTCPASQIVPVLDTLSLNATATDDGTLIRTEWFVVEAPDGSEATPAPPLSPSTSFRPFLPGAYRLRFVATDDASQQSACEVDLDVIVEERLRVEQLWDIDVDPAPQIDIDLHLLHPDATAWFSSPLDCYYSNKTPSWGPLDSGSTDDGVASNDPSLDIDDTDGRGPENIDIPSPLLGVPYRVGAHFYSDNGGGPESQVIIRIYCDGEVAQSFGPFTLNGISGGSSSTNDFWKVADVVFSESGCEITSLVDAEGAPLVVPSSDANTAR